MPGQVQRDELRRLMESGAQIVEVLPRDEYERVHLPGAINIPLDELSAETVEQLRRDHPVVVYCFDAQ